MTKDEIKATTTVPQILARYGVQVRYGRCKAICHNGSRLTAKVSDEFYFCFKCNHSMDIFDIVMHFEGCDFCTAFEILGGSDKPSFKAQMLANKARKEREQKELREREIKAQKRQINGFIKAYRLLIAGTEPLSDEWCFYKNGLEIQLGLLELLTESR